MAAPARHGDRLAVRLQERSPQAALGTGQRTEHITLAGSGGKDHPHAIFLAKPNPQFLGNFGGRGVTGTFSGARSTTWPLGEATNDWPQNTMPSLSTGLPLVSLMISWPMRLGGGPPGGLAYVKIPAHEQPDPSA